MCFSLDGRQSGRSLYLGKKMPYGAIDFGFMTISIEIVPDTDIQSIWTVKISALAVSVTSDLVISGNF